MAAEFRLTGVDASVPPWPLLIEVSRETPPYSWVLVGGMMVHLHALRGRVTASRPTTDVDLLLTVETVTRSVSLVAAPLQTLGLLPADSRHSFHRFARGDDIVDVMVSNRAGAARWGQRPIMRAPGAAMALEDPDTYIFDADGTEVRVLVPNPRAAIVLKSAAYGNDQRDRGRHLEDLAVLFAAAPADRDPSWSAPPPPAALRASERSCTSRLADP